MKSGWVYRNLVFGLCLVVPGCAWSVPGMKQKADPAAPIVNYHFKVGGEFSGGEDIWINQVYLGNMPFTITREEFQAKVPFLQEPPEGYVDGNKHQLQGHWFEFRFVDLVPPRRGRGSYHTEFKTYYARVKLNDEWGRHGHGSYSGSGNDYLRNYHASIHVDFPSREKRIAAKAKRLDTLLQIARLANYQVDSEWREAVRSYGHNGWETLLGAAEQEKGLEALVSAWVRDEYRIGKDNPKRIFERICKEADAEKRYYTGSPQGLAITMIYEQLDYESLIDKYVRAIKSKSWLYKGYSRTKLAHKAFVEYRHARREPGDGDIVPASVSVLRHVLQLWDQKLDAENADPDNPIEKTVTPAFLAYRGDLDLASEIGGSVYEQYLLRKYRRERRIEGSNLGSENTEYEYGLRLNKWLYHLVRLDTPAGRAFRSRHSTTIEEMARLILTSRFGNEDKPPEFLFLDLDRGKHSLAFTFWEEYILISEDASGWEHDRLLSQLSYLARLGNLATDDMYKECWQRFKGDYGYSTLIVIKVLEIVPTNRKQFMARYLLDRVQEMEIDNKEMTVRELEFFLIQQGETRALQEFRDITKSKRHEQYARNVVNRPIALNHAFVKVLSRHENLNIRKTVFPVITRYPTPEYRKLLDDFQNDSDENVKKLAQETFTELDRISKLPLAELVAYPAGEGRD